MRLQLLYLVLLVWCFLRMSSHQQHRTDSCILTCSIMGQKPFTFAEGNEENQLQRARCHGDSCEELFGNKLELCTVICWFLLIVTQQEVPSKNFFDQMSFFPHNKKVCQRRRLRSCCLPCDVGEKKMMKLVHNHLSLGEPFLLQSPIFFALHWFKNVGKSVWFKPLKCKKDWQNWSVHLLIGQVICKKESVWLCQWCHRSSLAAVGASFLCIHALR